MSFSNEEPSNLKNKKDDNNEKMNNEPNISSKKKYLIKIKYTN